MTNVKLIENDCEILFVLLKPKEVCPIDNCGYEPCAGKSNRRDHEFPCNLQVLKRMFGRRQK